MSKKNKQVTQRVNSSQEEKSATNDSKKRQKNEEKINRIANLTPYDVLFLEDLENRRLCLFGEINTDDEYDGESGDSSISELIMRIMRYNREDKGIKPKDRKPIMLYINSPGGDVIEVFGLVSAIETSRTPVYTVNIGQWSSMAFLIGITGDKRYSLPNMTFLLHDGWTGAENSVNKVCDQILFEKHYEKKVVRSHVLKYTKIAKKTYKKIKRKEMYFLPELALKYGVIDEIVDDIDEIL